MNKKTFAIIPTAREPVQPVAPLFVQPAAQLPHVRPPGVLVHARAL